MSWLGKVRWLLLVMSACVASTILGAVPSFASAAAARPAAAARAQALTAPLSAAADDPAQTYKTVVLTDNPAAYYRLGETSGSVATDSSGHGINATYGAGAAFNSPGAVPDDTDKAVSASDERSVVQVPAGNLPAGATTRTVEFWYRSGTSSDYLPVISYAGGLSLFVKDQAVLVRGRNDNYQQSFDLPYTVTDKAWHLWDLALNQDNSASVFLDGQPIGTTGGISVNTSASGTVDLGGRSGDYDELAIYPGVLAAARISAHWTRGGSSVKACAAKSTGAYGGGVTADAPAVFYRLGDLSGSRVAFDSSGHCINAAVGSYAATSSSAVAGEKDTDAAVTAPQDKPAVVVPTATLPSADTARTIEFWYRTDVSSDYQPVLSYASAFSLFVRDQAVLVRGRNDNYQQSFNLPYIVTDKAWHLWDVTVNPDNSASVFLDGQPIGTTGGLSINTGTSQYLALGGRAGDYDELAVYPGVLGTDRITAHWTRGNSSAAACSTLPAAAYPGAVRSDHPAVFYRLGDLKTDSGSRVAFDASGNCMNAALASYATSSAGSSAGDGDGAVSGPDERPVLEAPSGAMPAGGTARTVEFWYRTGAGGGDYQQVMSHAGGLTLFVRDQAALVRGRNDNYQQSFGLPYVVTDNAWHLWDLTVNPDNSASLFLDGQPIGTTGGLAIDTTTSRALELGGRPGSYDELAVYPGVLGTDRITAHWTRGNSSAAACAAVPTAAYPGAVKDDHPAVFYRLGDLKTDSGSRVAFDASGNCMNAALSSYATATAGSSAGDADGAVSAPDERPVVEAPSGAIPAGTNARTVEFWYRTNAGGTDYKQVMSHAGGLTLFVADQAVLVRGRNDNYQQSFGLPYVVTDNTWHLWDLTVNPDNSASVFLDGQPIGTTGGLAIDTTTSRSLELGGRPGTYDELAVYPGVLTPARITTHWTRGGSTAPACAGTSASAYGRAVNADNPAAFYRLGDLKTDPGSRVAFDSSGHCMNGVLASYTTTSSGAVAGDSDGAVSGPQDKTAAILPTATLPAGDAPRTAEFWYRTDVSSDYRPVLTWAGGWTLFVADQTVLVRGRNDNYQQSFTLPSRINDQAWHLWDLAVNPDNSSSVYLDGALVGTTGGLSINTSTSQSLALGGRAGDYDELAVYAGVLNPDRIAAHWIEGFSGQNASITGVVKYDGNAVPGSLVEACNSANECTRSTTNQSGRYLLSAARGTYGVTAYPPAQGPASVGHQNAAQVTVDTDGQRATADIDLVSLSLPPNSAIDSPSIGDQTSGTPRLYWAEPTVFRTTGCPNGTGAMVIQSAADGQQRTATLVEKPLGSGQYSALIPPLSPLHGTASFDYSIVCRAGAGTPFLPGGGPASGGNTVLLHIESSSPVATVKFGSAAGTSLKKLADGLYQLSAPSGTGDTPVTVVFENGTSRAVGTYHYVTTVEQSFQGPADGGQSITITGDGFTPNATVLFGTQPSASVTFVSPKQLKVTVPAGVGTQPVSVISGGGFNRAGDYTWFGQAATNLREADRKEQLKLGLSSTYDYVTAVKEFAKNPYTTSPEVSTSVIRGIGVSLLPMLLGLNDSQQMSMAPIDVLKAMALIAGVENPVFDVTIIVLSVAMFAADQGLIGGKLGDFLRDPLGFLGLIDPSGTIVDRNGNPVSGAKATILRRQDDGTYTPVPAGSPMIDPSINPQTTPDAGGFSWLAAAGTYKVRGEASTCVDPQTGTGATAEIGPFVLPPPALGLVLTLPCSTGPTPKPTVTGIDPSAVTDAGGDEVIVSGTGLSKATKVEVGGVEAISFAALSSYALKVKVPAGHGVADLRVTTPGGITDTTASDRITYVAPPASTPLGTPTMTLTTSPATPQVGTPVTVSAQVKAPAGQPVATGTVTFTEAGQTLAQATVDAAGKASTTIQAPAAGSRTIVATYSGDTRLLAASQQISFTVQLVPTTTTLVATPSPATAGTPVTLTATTLFAAGPATGSVTFQDNGVTLGTAMLGADGKATISTSTLSAGTHSLTARYAGTQVYAASTGSASLTISATQPIHLTSARHLRLHGSELQEHLRRLAQADH